MGPTPIGLTLLIATDEDSKFDARAMVASVAELMIADHLGLDIGLRTRRQRLSHAS